MRLLVGCPYCKRQYDASQLTVGQSFRCQCGHSLTVQGPRGHEAAVVCCALRRCAHGRRAELCLLRRRLYLARTRSGHGLPTLLGAS